MGALDGLLGALLSLLLGLFNFTLSPAGIRHRRKLLEKDEKMTEIAI